MQARPQSDECCCGTSTWVMVNTLTRKLAKMPDEMREKMEYLAPHPSRYLGFWQAMLFAEKEGAEGEKISMSF